MKLITVVGKQNIHIAATDKIYDEGSLKLLNGYQEYGPIEVHEEVDWNDLVDAFEEHYPDFGADIYSFRWL